MFASITAAHSPLIRNYAAPPSPGTTPSIVGTPVPATDGVAFAVTALPSLYGTTGTLIPLTTLATVDCADDSMVIALSEPVPGLTFSYSAKTLKVSGTPTTPTGVHRVVVTYITTSNTIRGSSSHTITIVAAAEVLTIGAMANASGRVGVPMSVSLATPSANFPVDVVALQSGAIPGVAAALAWTKTASAGSGTLTLAGTPTQAGAYSLSASYYGNGALLGTSTHSVSIAAAFEAPAPAPAPTPAPPPPSPSPPPPAAPAPQPGSGPDSLFERVEVLMGFEPEAFTRNYFGRRIAGETSIVETRYSDTQFVSDGATQAAGAVGGGAQLVPGAMIAGGISPSNDTGLTVECMVDIDEACWAAMRRYGSDSQLCPIVRCEAGNGRLLWALGISSIGGGANFRSFFWTALDVRPGEPRQFVMVQGPRLSNARPGRFVHLCGQIRFIGTSGTYDSRISVWFDGAAAPDLDPDYLNSITRPYLNTPNVVKIGGPCSPIQTEFGSAPTSRVVQFSGVIDELRVTKDSRYAAGSGQSLAGFVRTIPWPRRAPINF